jgi:hypothetical protein
MNMQEIDKNNVGTRNYPLHRMHNIQYTVEWRKKY